jgi:hypothetical protein
MTNAERAAHEADERRYGTEHHEVEHEEREPAVHARAELDARYLPCGQSNDDTVHVGDDAEVTCWGCSAELARRDYLKKMVVRTGLALVSLFALIGRRSVLPVIQLKLALDAYDYPLIGKAAGDVLRLALEEPRFCDRRSSLKIDAFSRAVDAAGLRRSARTLEQALAAMPGVSR